MIKKHEDIQLCILVSYGLSHIATFQPNFSSAHSGPFWPACGPAPYSNARYFSSSAGPAFMVNATGYGHLDMMDSLVLGGLQALNLCSYNGEAVEDEYRFYMAGEIVAFLKGLSYNLFFFSKYLKFPS